MTNEASPALQYWQSELATKDEATKQRYREYFNEFFEFIGKNPDELIAQRQQDFTKPRQKNPAKNRKPTLSVYSHKKDKRLCHSNTANLFCVNSFIL